ncbi:hypothetical protein [Azospirillum sp. TSO5]|uniref:hypothetical protein n=1 Tax=Azospirillum sp. TSO5 TaxID=716760 RepID=UPI000D611380|nr:hypothetical protein [Azospirillum sp. TSO5]PWC98036.1 hypothetical protein TSO5_03255 [Azospirillum sp. TSO5]
MGKRKQKPAAPRPVTREQQLRAQGLQRDRKTGLVLSINGDDTGTPERARHGMGVTVQRHFITEEARVSQRVGALVVAESLFETMVERGLIADELPAGASERQRADAEVSLDRRVSAANWLRKLWESTGLDHRVSASYSVASTRTDGEMSDADAENQARFREVWRAVGAQRADLLAAVVCLQEVPKGATAAALREALDALANWRGL